MKIYTRTGDDGTTGLIGGKRIGKADPRLECTGDVDELNALVGSAAVQSTGELFDALRKIQNDLFVIGSHLALSDPADAIAMKLPPLEDQVIARLEMQIDSAEAELAPLRNFILPGGSDTAARLHVARTVCRRAERVVVGYATDRPVPTLILTYLNRLSDWLFVHAHLANHQAGVADVLWEH